MHDLHAEVADSMGVANMNSVWHMFFGADRFEAIPDPTGDAENCSEALEELGFRHMMNIGPECGKVWVCLHRNSATGGWLITTTMESDVVCDVLCSDVILMMEYLRVHITPLLRITTNATVEEFLTMAQDIFFDYGTGLGCAQRYGDRDQRQRAYAKQCRAEAAAKTAPQIP